MDEKIKGIIIAVVLASITLFLISKLFFERSIMQSGLLFLEVLIFGSIFGYIINKII